MLRKPTQILRRMLIQEAREILGPELGRDSKPIEGVTRKIQAIIPESPAVFVWADHPTPLELGPNRTYKVPQPPTGAQFDFVIMSHQKLYGASEEGLGLVTLVVEYQEGEP